MKIKFDKTFDWFDVLERLDKGDTISDDQYRTLEYRAGRWPTCACGQLCKALPKRESEISDAYKCAPKDGELFRRGVSFSDYVSAKKWGKALETFNKIEARSAKLLGLKFVPRHPIKIHHEQKPYAVTMGRSKHETARLHSTG